MLNYFTEAIKWKLKILTFGSPFLLISQYYIPQATIHKTLKGEVAEKVTVDKYQHLNITLFL